MGAARHVLTILAVDDVERSAAFYVAAFGWTRTVDTPRYVELALPDGMRLGIYAHDGFARNTGHAPELTPDGGITATELYLAVDDVEAAAQDVRDAGGRELSPVAQRDWGDVAAYFADPDGNVVVVARLASAG